MSLCRAGVQAIASSTSGSGPDVETRTIVLSNCYGCCRLFVQIGKSDRTGESVGEPWVQRERRFADLRWWCGRATYSRGLAWAQLRRMVCITVALISTGEIGITPSHVSWLPSMIRILLAGAWLALAWRLSPGATLATQYRKDAMHTNFISSSLHLMEYTVGP